MIFLECFVCFGTAAMAVIVEIEEKEEAFCGFGCDLDICNLICFKIWLQIWLRNQFFWLFFLVGNQFFWLQQPESMYSVFFTNRSTTVRRLVHGGVVV